MGTIKIKLNTWSPNKNHSNKFKRNLASREGYIDICPKTKKIFLKEGSSKWKTYDIGISRHEDKSYIQERKNMYSGLCFGTKKEAKDFMTRHKDELEKIAKSNPIFDHWSIMNVIGRFEPVTKKMYGIDIKED